MILVVILTVRREAIELFHTFERKAATVMARYDGRIERTVVVAGYDPTLFKEVHLVTFPNEQAFRAYQQDTALQELAHLRNAAVVQTEILAGEAGPDYHTGS